MDPNGFADHLIHLTLTSTPARWPKSSRYCLSLSFALIVLFANLCFNCPAFDCLFFLVFRIQPTVKITFDGDEAVHFHVAKDGRGKGV
jgi:hypothetical protein